MSRLDLAITDLRVWVDVFSARTLAGGVLTLCVGESVIPDDRLEESRARLEPYAKKKGWDGLAFRRP